MLEIHEQFFVVMEQRSICLKTTSPPTLWRGQELRMQTDLLRTRGVCPRCRILCLVHLASRVNGTLAVARAMGDFSFKADKQLPPEEQQVTCNPEIKKFPMQVRRPMALATQK